MNILGFRFIRSFLFAWTSSQILSAMNFRNILLEQERPDFGSDLSDIENNQQELRTDPDTAEAFETINEDLKSFAVSLYKFFLEPGTCDWRQIHKEMKKMSTEVEVLRSEVDDRMARAVQPTETIGPMNAGEIIIISDSDDVNQDSSHDEHLPAVENRSGSRGGGGTFNRDNRTPAEPNQSYDVNRAQIPLPRREVAPRLDRSWLPYEPVQREPGARAFRFLPEGGTTPNPQPRNQSPYGSPDMRGHVSEGQQFNNQLQQVEVAMEMLKRAENVLDLPGQFNFS